MIIQTLSSSVCLTVAASFNSPQLDHGGHGAVAEGVGGAASVREELPGFPDHREHFTSVGTPQLQQHVRSRCPSQQQSCRLSLTRHVWDCALHPCSASVTPTKHMKE